MQLFSHVFFYCQIKTNATRQIVKKTVWFETKTFSAVKHFRDTKTYKLIIEYDTTGVSNIYCKKNDLKVNHFDFFPNFIELDELQSLVLSLVSWYMNQRS